MGDLTKNLSRKEIKCKCGTCGTDLIDYSIVEAFQMVCDAAAEMMSIPKVVANIVSGCRCDWWNGHEGGKVNSLHAKGKAIDFNIIGLNSDEIAFIAEKVLDMNKFDYYCITDKNLHLEFDPK